MTINGPLKNRQSTVVEVVCGDLRVPSVLVSLDLGPSATAVLAATAGVTECPPDQLKVTDGVSSVQASVASSMGVFSVVGIPLPLGTFNMNLAVDEGDVEVVTMLNGTVEFVPSSVVAGTVMGDHQPGSPVVREDVLVGFVGPSGSLLNLAQLCGATIRC
jgi:hypothetical protein